MVLLARSVVRESGSERCRMMAAVDSSRSMRKAVNIALVDAVRVGAAECRGDSKHTLHDNRLLVDNRTYNTEYFVLVQAALSDALDITVDGS